MRPQQKINPKPQPLNPKPQTPNQNSKPWTLPQDVETPNPGPYVRTPNPGPWLKTSNSKPWTLYQDVAALAFKDALRLPKLAFFDRLTTAGFGGLRASLAACFSAATPYATCISKRSRNVFLNVLLKFPTFTHPPCYSLDRSF